MLAELLAGFFTLFLYFIGMIVVFKVTIVFITVGALILKGIETFIKELNKEKRNDD